MVRSITFLAVLLLFSIHPLTGQNRKSDDGRRRLEELKQVKLIEALNLNEEQAVRLLAREKEFREKERLIQDRRHELLKTLETRIEEKAADDVLLNVIRKIHEAGLEMQNQRREFLLSLDDILSTQQIARMIVFEHRFTQEMRSLIQRHSTRRKRSDR